MSLLRSRWPEIAWAVFAVVNVAAMFAFPDWETVPFHFVWISLTLLYAVRVWSWPSSIAVLAVVMALTALGEIHPGAGGAFEPHELAEVPLMGAVFLSVIWLARRRQQATREVARAAEREREFLRNASHQLRTPITVARGHAQLIQQSTPDPETAADVDVILDELSSLASISDRLLMLAAATNEGFLHVKPTRLDLLVDQIADRWRPCADRDWAVAADGPVVVPADAARLTVALDALIENAVNHTEPGDEISLRASSDGRTATIAVRDAGAGIPAAVADRVFDGFSRGSDGANRRGTGLGLPMVQAIATAHGGEAWLQTSVGAGTTVEIRLPA